MPICSTGCDNKLEAGRRVWANNRNMTLCLVRHLHHTGGPRVESQGASTTATANLWARATSLTNASAQRKRAIHTQCHGLWAGHTDLRGSCQRTGTQSARAQKFRRLGRTKSSTSQKVFHVSGQPWSHLREANPAT